MYNLAEERRGREDCNDDSECRANVPGAVSYRLRTLTSSAAGKVIIKPPLVGTGMMLETVCVVKLLTLDQVPNWLYLTGSPALLRQA